MQVHKHQIEVISASDEVYGLFTVLGECNAVVGNIQLVQHFLRNLYRNFVNTFLNIAITSSNQKFETVTTFP
jgi:hypothetical protein